MVKVSIIIPVYNVEKYLPKCLDSLVNQTLKDIEIILVNDGSPDNSQKIIDDYVKKYPKIVKSYIKENGGQGSARNYGFEKATGEYIGYVDSDDYVELDMYEKLYNKAKKEDLDIAICENYVVYEDSDKKLTEKTIHVLEDNVKNAFFGKMAVWNKIYKKSLVDNLKFRSRLWYEDLDFSVKVLSNAKKIGYVDEPLYDYLLREGSTMNNDNVKRNLEILQAFDELKDCGDREMIELLAISHIYIAAIVRVINAKADGKKEIINTLRDYVQKEFPNYKNNKYLKFLDRNKKIIYNLITAKQYWLVKFIFLVKSILK